MSVFVLSCFRTASGAIMSSIVDSSRGNLPSALLIFRQDVFVHTSGSYNLLMVAAEGRLMRSQPTSVQGPVTNRRPLGKLGMCNCLVSIC